MKAAEKHQPRMRGTGQGQQEARKPNNESAYGKDVELERRSTSNNVYALLIRSIIGNSIVAMNTLGTGSDDLFSGDPSIIDDLNVLADIATKSTAILERLMQNQRPRVRQQD